MGKGMPKKNNEQLLVKKFLGTFIVTLGLVCLAGFITCTIVFVANQLTFNKAYSDASIDIASLSPENQEITQVSIDHLEKLQQIQKNAASNDVMSFLYSVLSTILVGLCAGFVVKSYSHAEEAKENAQVAIDNAKDAEKSANEALEHFNSEKTIAQNALDNFMNAKKDIQKTSELLKNAQSNAEMERKSYNFALQAIKKQSGILAVYGIHIEIVHARAALMLYDQIDANQRIFNIYRSILKIENLNDYKTIFQLQQEILGLETAVERFREFADSKTDKLDDSTRTSILQSITRYENELSKAVKHCDMLMQSISTEEKNVDTV